MKINKRELFKRYSLEVIKTNDLEELQNIFDYCSGLIIKNSPLAEANETKISEKNADTYLKAYKGIDENNSIQREKIKNMYEESNKYYKMLLDNYNIDPYISRTADDFEILTSTNKYNNGSLTLDTHCENLFLSCYKEALLYFNNVIRNKSFQGEDTYRDFFEVYLIFMAINRYISYRMFDQFNVDTFTKYQCKNYFISNGVDYFDDLPLVMQRRLIKLLNNLQLNKGDDIAFDLIKQVLQTDNLNIYRYTLVKNKNNELNFYKVPYKEELNPDSNEIYSFETITSEDPYWRASKNEILAQKFNILETKYISVEYAVNILKSSYTSSYFTNMLNELEISNKDKGLITSINFKAENISGNKISLYDSFQALYCLFLIYITNNYKTGDNIEIPMESDNGIYKMIESLNNIYGYKRNYNNDYEINDLIDKTLVYIKDNIEEQKKIYGEIVNPFANELALLNNKNLNLKSYYTTTNSNFNSIEKEYYKKSSSNYNSKYNNSPKDEFLILSKFINVKKIQNPLNRTDNLLNLVITDDLYSALIYLCQLIFTNSLEIQYLSIHKGLSDIFKKFLSFLIINNHIDDIKTFNISDKEKENNEFMKTISPEIYNIDNRLIYNKEYDIFYNYMIENKSIMTDLINYVNQSYGVNNPYLVNFLGLKNTEEGPEAFLNMFINLPKFYINEKINKYRNLKTFIELFTTFEKLIYVNSENNNNSYSNINKSNFTSAYEENEKLREQLENTIYECQDKEVHRNLRKLWYLLFKSEYRLELIKKFKSFRDYLKENNSDLYIYISNINEDNPRKDIEEKILNLTDKMENYLGNFKYIISDSTLNILFNKYKLFAEILIETFKAYTIDTIYSDNIIEANDKFSNYIKIFDNIEVEDLEYTLLDYIDIHDTVYDKDDPEGHFDYNHRLMIQNVIVTKDENGEVIINKDLNNIKCLIYVFESNDNLQSGFEIESDTGFQWFPPLYQKNILLNNDITINEYLNGEKYTVEYANNHPGIVDHLLQPTCIINGNKSRIIDLKRNKSYLIYGMYHCGDVFAYQLKINNYDYNSDYPFRIIKGHLTDETLMGFDTSLEIYEKGISSLTSFISSKAGSYYFVIVSKEDNSYETMFFDRNSNSFISLGNFFNRNYFKSYYENNQRFTGEENNKLIYHRRYWDNDYIDTLNNDENPYNDIKDITNECYIHKSGQTNFYKDTTNNIQWVDFSSSYDTDSGYIINTSPTEINTKDNNDSENNTSDIVTFSAAII